jgi:glycosyltransferase involved in cell wall biosynthesis
MRLGDRVVAVSHAEQELLVKRGFDKDRVVVVLNGPNRSPREESVPADQLGFPELKTPFVTTVCGLHHRKGVHDLIEGFAEAVRGRPDWQLYIVGDGPDKGALQDLVTKLQASERIVLLGATRRPKDILAKADIFVLASYAEPFGLAVAEAREAGCAIIATAVGGVPELLEHGQAGILVEPGSPRQIAAELGKLMSDAEVLQTMKAKAKRGSEYYSVARMVMDYESLYDSLRR